MIDPPPKDPTLQEAAEWFVTLLHHEGFPILVCGRYALDLQNEYTGSVDADILIGTNYRGALYTLDEYQDRGDIDLVGGNPEGVTRYLVAGSKPVDVLDVSSVHDELFDILRNRAATMVKLGGAGEVPAVTREGYFVLAIMLGLRGFASEKPDPMAKVREAWDMFGERTDLREVRELLKSLGVDGLDEILSAS